MRTLGILATAAALGGAFWLYRKRLAAGPPDSVVAAAEAAEREAKRQQACKSAAVAAAVPFPPRQSGWTSIGTPGKGISTRPTDEWRPRPGAR